MPWEPDMDTALRLAWFTAGFFFLVFLVSLIGEILEWWDLAGEIGMGVGAVVSILLTLVAVIAGAGRQQVDTVGSEVRSVGDDVQHNGKMLARIEDALVGEGGVVHELDVIQVELDKQTGVLGEQLSVLGEIRDQI